MARHRGRLDLELLRLLTKLHNVEYDTVLDFQLSFLVVMKKKLESSGVLQLAQYVQEVSCLWLLLSAVLHLLAVRPDVVLVVAITEVLWDSVSLSTSWCVSK